MSCKKIKKPIFVNRNDLINEENVKYYIKQAFSAPSTPPSKGLKIDLIKRGILPSKKKKKRIQHFDFKIEEGMKFVGVQQRRSQIKREQEELIQCFE